MILNRSLFPKVLAASSPQKCASAYLSYIEDQIRHDSWRHFSDDVLSLPVNARRLYLPLCFNIVVKGDGFATAFSFYGAGGDQLIEEILAGFRLANLVQVPELIQRAFIYWRDPKSPMHSAPVPWLAMDEDLNDVHGQYFCAVADLHAKVGEKIIALGENGLHSHTENTSFPS